MKTISAAILKEKMILFNFYTSWCGTCNVMKPELEKFSKTVCHTYPIIDVNLERDSHIISKYKIKTMPTLILFKEGKEVWRHEGLINADHICKEIGDLEGCC